MCLFTHFAAGALAGGATGSPAWAVPAGLASHAVLDVIPHYDHPDWRIELAGGMVSLVVLLLLPFGSLAAVIGGLAGMAPDLENLFQKLGKMPRSRFIFPTHTGLLPHGRALGPRSLIWQAGIFVGCLLALGLVRPGAAEAAAGSEAPVLGKAAVTVLQSDAQRTLVRVSVPLEREPASWSGFAARDVRWADPRHVDEESGPLVSLLPPRVPVTLAVPTVQPPVVRIVEASWWKEPAGSWTEDQLLAAGLPGVFRGVPLSGFVLGLGLGEGILADAVIEVTHQPAGKYRDHLNLPAGLEAGPGSEGTTLAPAGVVNPALYARLAAGAGQALIAAAAAKGGDDPWPDPFALTSHWVKLRVSANGWHRLSGEALAGYGVPTTSVDPSKLRVFKGGGLALDPDPEVPDWDQYERVALTEVAIEVADGGDGEWNLDDDLLFYGLSSSTWKDRLDPSAERLDHYDHPYAAEAVYWVTWEDDATPSPFGTPPSRVEVLPSPAGGGDVLDMGRVRMHLERQRLDTGGLFADNWSWDFDIYTTRDYGFDLRSPVTGRPARFVVDVRGFYGTLSEYPFETRAWANGAVGEAVASVFTVATQSHPDSLRVRLVGDFTPLAGANVLTVANDSRSYGNVPKQNLALDSFDISYLARLELPAGGEALEFLLPAGEDWLPAGSADLRVAAPGAQEMMVWDVSDPARPVRLVGAFSLTAPDDYEVGLAMPSSGTRQLAALRPEALLTPAGGELAHPVSLRSRSTALDHVTVYEGTFAAAAEQLATFRSTLLPGVDQPAAVHVLVDDIYDNFSGGQKDARAIRNYLRHVYTAGAGRLRYACFLGNASRDHRNYLGRPERQGLYDFLPTVIRTVFPSYPRPVSRETPYAADDALVSFDQPPVPGTLDRPDLAFGRISASTLGEALAIVGRTISFSSDPETGTWRNRVTFVADDANRPDYGSRPIVNEISHTEQADLLSEETVPLSIDVQKIYGVAYSFPSPSSNVKPQMNTDIKGAVNQGTTILHYIGHGAEDNLADEQIFQSDDIPNLFNGMKRPVFIAFSCDVGVFDSPNYWSMAEKFLTSPAGGAIASICASQVSYIYNNDRLSYAFYQQLYPGRRVDPGIPVGAALAQAKAVMVSVDDVSNSQRFIFFGDPALALPHPRDELAFAEGSADTLVAGLRQTVRLDGDDPQAPGPGATYDLLVEESDFDQTYVVHYVSTRPDGSLVFTPTDRSYRRTGSTVFHGTGMQSSGVLEIPFMNPVQFRYGEDGRVRLTVASGDEELVAVARVPAVRGSGTTGDDVWGPRIRLAFDDDRYRVRAGALLQADLEDTNGIAILGTSPGNSILLEFDDTGLMTDVTSSFAFEANSFTSGSITFPLPEDLGLGRHMAALHASDALGNVGSDTLSFLVIPEGVRGMESVTLFPNPTPGPCRLLFELSDPMGVQWDVYTVAGRRLKTIRRDFEAAGPAILEWDGRDQEGDEIANGTYLFVLRGFAAAADERDLIKTGKLVIMR
ncbi:MAG: C25 family cysteine peptidase [Candidatus Krumholzibacteriia bacterium]